MSIFEFKPPWYVAGLAFDCGQCGRCCAGPDEGYVWINDAESQLLAQFLGTTVEQLRSRYLRRVGRRYTIVEDAKTHDCIFLTARIGESGACGKGCSIYEVRPAQCRTWPFWPSNLSSPAAWARAGERCPGINRGEIHPFTEIQAKRDATES